MPPARWASTRLARPRSWPDARRLAAAAAVVASLAATAAGADFTGRVVSVADGDSLTLRNGTREIQVRLWGIDAPEHGQPWSKRAREALAARALRRDARVVERGIDAYGRTLARVSVDGTDLAEAQLRDGWAWVFRRYTDDPGFVALEADARASRRGLWADRDPEPPWRFRERAKSAGETPLKPR
jgi:micrococcal nuclease